jgi:hypothetical protein
MLRLLCLVACFLFGNATAENKYIRVVGEGNTIEQAKENAFRNAVQQRAGAVVLTDRQSTFGKLIKDEVSMFSAGYVDDFKIVDVNQNGSNIKITLDVLVADSKLFNQILNTGKSTKDVDGERAGAALNTYLDQKQKGDRLINKVLDTYPQNAFILSQKPFTLTVDSYRNATFNIPYTIKWNYDFITAMNEAMKLVEDDIGFLTKAPSNVIIMAKNPKDFLLGSKNTYKFNDILLLTRIKDAMASDREVRMMVDISDSNGDNLLQSCYIPDSVSGRKPSFYSIGDPRILIIHGNESETNVIRLTIDPQHNYVVQRAARIELSVVPESKCHW